jgi:hypothetical protein
MFDCGITENNVKMFDCAITENNVKIFDCAITENNVEMFVLFFNDIIVKIPYYFQ